MTNILTGNMIDPVTQISDVALLRWYERCQSDLVEVQEKVGRLQQEILRRMEERGASAIPDEEYVCELVTKTNYDQTQLRPFLEILTGRELEDVFVPAHEETIQIASKWKVQQLIALAKKHGTEALQIIEQAKIPGVRTLKFAKRERTTLRDAAKP